MSEKEKDVIYAQVPKGWKKKIIERAKQETEDNEDGITITLRTIVIRALKKEFESWGLSRD